MKQMTMRTKIVLAFFLSFIGLHIFMYPVFSSSDTVLWIYPYKDFLLAAMILCVLSSFVSLLLLITNRGVKSTRSKWRTPLGCALVFLWSLLIGGFIISAIGNELVSRLELEAESIRKSTRASAVDDARADTLEAQ